MPTPRPTLWIDGDACPVRVKQIIAKAADRLQLAAVLVANQHQRPPSPRVKVVVVPGGLNVADDHIAERAAEGDVVVTADIPLAARLVPKGVHVLDHRGKSLDASNVGEALAMRNLADELRSGGLLPVSGPSAFSDRDAQAFAGAFDRLLTRLRAGWEAS